MFDMIGHFKIILNSIEKSQLIKELTDEGITITHKNGIRINPKLLLRKFKISIPGEEKAPIKKKLTLLKTEETSLSKDDLDEVISILEDVGKEIKR